MFHSLGYVSFFIIEQRIMVGGEDGNKRFKPFC